MKDKYPFLYKAKTWLIILLIVSTITRFWELGYIKEYVFDEVYHGFTAKMYALNRYEAWVWWENPPEGVAYEWTHPPLAKVIMSWGVQMFGGPGELPTKITKPTVEQSTEEKEAEKNTTKVLANSSFGWRFFSAVFGVLATYAIYLFSASVFKNKWIGILSAFLFTFDMLPLVQSRIAMNDIFAVTFMIFAFYFFTKREDILVINKEKIILPSQLLNYKLSPLNWFFAGIFIGCAVASKWTPLFALLLMGAYQVGVTVYYFILRLYRHRLNSEKRRQLIFKDLMPRLLQTVGYLAVCLGIIPLVIYWLSYWQLFTLPIYDYKGNSLTEVIKDKHWDQDRKNIGDRLKLAREGTCTKSYAEEFCNIQKLEGELKDTNDKEFVFTNLYNIQPYLADRLYIWWGLQQQMWWYHTNLKATHAYTSQWWTWPLDIRPVWFYVKYCNTGSDESMCKQYYATHKTKQNSISDVYTMGNPAIFWMIFPVLTFVGFYTAGSYRKWFYAFIPAAIVLLIQYNVTLDRSKLLPENSQGNEEKVLSISENLGATANAVIPKVMLFGMLLLLFLTIIHLLDYIFSKEEHREEKSRSFMPLVFVLFLFSSLWLPWARSPRIMFFYHFFPPMTFFYPLMAYVLYKFYQKNENWRKGVFVYLGIVVVMFFYLYPHVTGVLLPDTVRESYFWFASWK